MKFMERPDLRYNYYYPYYTQEIKGKKRISYSVVTVVHLSEEKGITLLLKYERNKITEIQISESTDAKFLMKAKENWNLVHYTQFAEEVEKIFRYLSDVSKALSSSKSYKKKSTYTTYFKHNNQIEMEIEHKKVHVMFKKFNYVIEDGKKKYCDSGESVNDKFLASLQTFIVALESQTTYTEIDNATFDNELNYFLEYFMEYFKCPKFIKKREYKP